MQEDTWRQALAEMADTLVAALLRFWKHDIVQVCLTLGMFLALAAPLLLVMLVLWYLDSTGWRPESGFYKIGTLPDMPSLATGVALWCADLRPVRRTRDTDAPDAPDARRVTPRPFPE